MTARYRPPRGPGTDAAPLQVSSFKSSTPLGPHSYPARLVARTFDVQHPSPGRPNIT